MLNFQLDCYWFWCRGSLGHLQDGWGWMSQFWKSDPRRGHNCEHGSVLLRHQPVRFFFSSKQDKLHKYLTHIAHISNFSCNKPKTTSPAPTKPTTKPPTQPTTKPTTKPPNPQPTTTASSAATLVLSVLTVCVAIISSLI